MVHALSINQISLGFFVSKSIAIQRKSMAVPFAFHMYFVYNVLKVNSV